MKANRKNLFLSLSRNFCGAVFAAISLGAVQGQTTGNWNYNGTVTASNNWNTVGSWTGLTGGLVPDAIGATVNFRFNIGGARTITLNGDKTVGSLSIDDPTSSFFAYTLSAGTPSTSRLIFDVESGNAVIDTPQTNNTTTNSIGVPITLNDPLELNINRTNVGGGLSIAGEITDGASSYSLTKNGDGALTLLSANTYDGGTFINGGRIQASNLGAFGSGIVTVASGGQALLLTSGSFANSFTIAGNGLNNTSDSGALVGAIRFQNNSIGGTVTLSADARIGAVSGTSGTITGPIIGALRNLEINSTVNASHTGNITLLGDASALTGTVTVARGTLRLGTASNLGGNLVVQDGASLYADNVGTAGGATVTGNLTVGSATGASIFCDASNDDALLVTGNLVLTGTNTVVLTSPPTSSSITVMTYSGTITGDATNFTLPGGLAAYRPGTGFTTSGNQVKLNLVQGELVWTGLNSNDWDTTAVNWNDGVDDTTFYNLDSVTFDDSSEYNNVIIPTGVTVLPAAILFDHSAVDYTMSGAGTIAGGATLTKEGTGAVTISTANTFEGGTFLIEGALRLGNNAALGVGPLTITGGQLSSDSVTARTLANPVILNGAVFLSDATANGAMTLSGGMTLTGNSTLESLAPLANSQTISGVITDGASSFQLTTKGTTAGFAFSAANTYDGGTVMESGRINASNAQAFGTGMVTVQDGAQAYLTTAGPFTNTFRIVGNGLTEPAGVLGAIRLQSGATVAGSIELAGNARIAAFGNTGTLSGVISEVSAPSSLDITNFNTGTDSTITISGNNTFSGGTTVRGTVINANSGTAFGTGPVTLMSNGTAARTTRVILGANLTMANDFVLDSNAVTSVAAITSFAGDNATVSTATVTGDIEVLQSVGGGGHLGSVKASNSTLRVTGQITSPNGASVVLRQGVVELGGGGSAEAMQIVDGTLRNVATNGVPTNAVLSIGTSGTVGDTGTYDLNGFSQTLAGLINSGVRPATVVNNGGTASTLTLNMPTSTSYAGVFAPGSQDIHLVKTGSGVLTLTGNSSSALGSLVVNGGGVNLTGTLGAPSYTAAFNTGSFLSGEGIMGGATTFNGGTLRVDPVTTSSLLNSGDLNVTGGILVELISPPVNGDPIEVISFSNTLTGNASNFTLVNAGNYRNPQFQVNASNVTLSFGAPGSLTWTGAGGNTWDINGTSNWVDSVPEASKYFVGDSATFGDTGSGTVVVNVAHSPASLTINSNQPYAFEGTGSIQTGPFTKDGSGLAQINVPCTITGPITLAAGALQFSPPAATAGTLSTDLSGAGTLIKGGEGTLSITQPNSGFTGSTVISRGELSMGTATSLGDTPNITFGNLDTLTTDVQRLNFPSSGVITSPVIDVAATSSETRIASTGATMSNATITKRGTGKLTIGHATALGNTTNFVTGTSSITVEAGTLAGSSQSPFSSTTTITLGNANTGTAATIVELPANQTTNNDVVTLSSPIVLSPDAPNSEAIFRYPGGTSSGSLSYSGTIALNGRDIYLENTSNVNTPSRLYNVTGVISGDGNVRVRGNSGTTIRVQANSTYTGDLYMMSGRIQTAFNTNGTESIPNTARIIMSAGASVGLANTAETVRGLVGGAATESSPTPALINQGRGDNNLCTLTLNDSNAANTHVFDGTIQNRTATALIAITKSGAATQVLNGVNSYTGNTTINAGTLEIGGAGQLGSGLYTSIVNVVSGATLKFNSTADQILRTSGTNDLRGAGTLVKENTGTLTLESTITAGHAFSGNITINGGTLIGLSGVNGGGGQPALGSRVNTRTFTINNGGTLQFNSGNILSNSHTGTTAPTLIINSGGVVTNGGTATNNALNNIELNGGTLTSTTGHTSSSEPFAPLYGAYNFNGTVTSTGDSTISTSDPVKGWIMMKVPGDQITNFNVVSGTLTVSAPLGEDIDNFNVGGLNKSGSGTMVMSGVNFYTGTTTVSEGTLALVGGSHQSPVTVNAGASLAFTLGSPTTSTSTFNLSNGTIKITGTPTLPSYDLITSSAGITGTPTLDAAVPGYQLQVQGNSLKLVEAGGYAAWASTNAVGSAANLDKDGDGVNNAVEYVLGGDVNTNDLGKLPTLQASGANFVFSFRRSRASLDGNTTVVIEVGNNLSGWPDVFTVGTNTGNSSSGVTVTENSPSGFDTITLTVAKDSAPTKFGRLKVTVTE